MQFFFPLLRNRLTLSDVNKITMLIIPFVISIYKDLQLFIATASVASRVILRLLFWFSLQMCYWSAYEMGPLGRWASRQDWTWLRLLPKLTPLPKWHVQISPPYQMCKETFQGRNWSQIPKSRRSLQVFAYLHPPTLHWGGWAAADRAASQVNYCHFFFHSWFVCFDLLL